MPDGGSGKGKAGGFGIAFKEAVFKKPFQQAVNDVMRDITLTNPVPKTRVDFIMMQLKIKLKMRLYSVYEEHQLLEGNGKQIWTQGITPESLLNQFRKFIMATFDAAILPNYYS